MKNNSPVIYLSFLVLCLIIGCVSCSSNLMKSGNNDWVEYRTNESGNIYFYKYVSIDKNGGNYIVQVLNRCVYSDLGITCTGVIETESYRNIGMGIIATRNCCRTGKITP